MSRFYKPSFSEDPWAPLIQKMPLEQQKALILEPPLILRPRNTQGQQRKAAEAAQDGQHTTGGQGQGQQDVHMEQQQQQQTQDSTQSKPEEPAGDTGGGLGDTSEAGAGGAVSRRLGKLQLPKPQQEATEGAPLTKVAAGSSAEGGRMQEGLQTDSGVGVEGGGDESGRTSVEGEMDRPWH
jgi:hypothetical protein